MIESPVAVLNAQEIAAASDRILSMENLEYTADYLNPEKRSIANSIQTFFNSGTYSSHVVTEYPTGHRRGRNKSITELVNKFKANLAPFY